jgi:hypothetical protein
LYLMSRNIHAIEVFLHKLVWTASKCEKQGHLAAPHEIREFQGNQLCAKWRNDEERLAFSLSFYG